MYTKFLGELERTEKMVSEYISNNVELTKSIKPEILETCSLSYIKRGGKKLRPAVMMLSCLVVGGSKEVVLPAAAAVELFHTWTLVHDDIIDNDNTRRGIETVHITASNYAKSKFNLNDREAHKYGTDTAVLTGDIQHGWSIALLSKNLIENGVKPEVALHLISKLQTDVLRTLVEGEMLDVDFGFYNIEEITDNQILDMLWRKTGILYEFAGLAGALIGQNSIEYNDEVKAIINFCSQCGIAFQVRDDILGLIGDEKKLGKPVGSDIREGKKTLLVREALLNANEQQKAQILEVVGNKTASESQIKKTTEIIVKLGGVDKAFKVAKDYVEKALPNLDKLKPSESKKLLEDWANYLIDRNF